MKRYNYRRNYRSKRNSSNWKYKGARKAGKVLRFFTDKNPFESKGKLPSHIYEQTVSPALNKASYRLNGKLGYKRGSNPTWGSIRYTFIRILMGLLSFAFFTAALRLIFKK